MHITMFVIYNFNN